MTETKRILIADDEAADVGLIQIVLEEQGLKDEAAVASTGEEVLDYLYRRGKFNGRTGGLPELILLDLKLPMISGIEILEELKDKEWFQDVSVVVFSSSLDEKDREKCLASGASEFRTKPIDFDAFRDTIQEVIETHLAG